MSVKQIKVGDNATLSRKVTGEDIRKMADISGNYNLIHIDEEYAKRTVFGKVIAHGIFGVGMISALLGNTLPGDGTIILSEEFRFLKPIYAGDYITAEVTVSEIFRNKERVLMAAVCRNQNDEVVMDGTVLTKFPQLP